MKMQTRMRAVTALKALDRAGGTRLSNALRIGYAAAARVIRDRAKETTQFKDKTGLTRKSWKVSQKSRPFNHAKLTNTSPHAVYLEMKPFEAGFMERAARSTGPEQVKAVRKALARHLKKVRAGPK